ncbi:glycosyltransferase [Marinicrinis sediminis]|uniref:Glycosyltransferase n=1 Tax=Marinicrinis sediminis TaxID=1652465 RepID=A0ABW5RB63_9BACL
MSKVSIITACYNSEDSIERTMKSVLNQKIRANTEYIIVDGGSTDRTMEIIAQYQSQLDKVISEPDEGIYDAFNKGIAASTGDIIYFLNSDDYLLDSDVVDEMATYMDESDLAAVYGNILRIDAMNGIDQVYGREFSLEDFKRGYMPPHQAFFVRREMFDKYGLFNLKYKSSGDFNFILEVFLGEQEKMKYINRTVAAFQIGGLSTGYHTRIMGMRETERIIADRFQINADLSSAEVENNARYRQWLERLLLDGDGVTSTLKEQGVQRVAIFGTMNTALYLLKDLEKEGIEVLCFIDNNTNMQGRQLKGINIVPQQWLSVHGSELDAVIVSVENANDKQIMNELKGVCGPVQVISWKELV